MKATRGVYRRWSEVKAQESEIRSRLLHLEAEIAADKQRRIIRFESTPIYDELAVEFSKHR